VTNVDVLRRFNRAYTQRIGLLDDSYLATGRALGPSRLLFEVGVGGARVVDLRRRLGLDSGYTSRLLRQLEAEGLVSVDADPADRRQRMVGLTRAGRAEWQRLDRRSQQVAERLVAPLSPRQRVELDGALEVADRLLRAATVEFDAVDVRSADAQWAMGQYFGELAERFPSGFDAAASLRSDALAFRPPDGVMVVVRTDLAPIGCGAVQRVDARVGEIKRMWIDPDWRGLGLGRRLIDHLEATARRLGRTSVVLDTNDTLVEAITMSEQAGYRSIERYNDNPYAQRWFAKDL
jgi:DNA-binding MarR family transcriptional regulator/GNAT superfamily N-acetyltransferase